MVYFGYPNSPSILMCIWGGGVFGCFPLMSITVVVRLNNTDIQFQFQAFRRKVAKAGEPCRLQGIAFIPLAADTLGGWHGVANEQVQKLGVHWPDNQARMRTRQFATFDSGSHCSS